MFYSKPTESKTSRSRFVHLSTISIAWLLPCSAFGETAQEIDWKASIFPASDFEPTDAAQGLREEGWGCMVKPFDYCRVSQWCKDKHFTNFSAYSRLRSSCHTIMEFFSVSPSVSDMKCAPSIFQPRSSFLRSVALPVANLPWNNNFKRRQLDIGIGHHIPLVTPLKPGFWGKSWECNLKSIWRYSWIAAVFHQRVSIYLRLI